MTGAIRRTETKVLIKAYGIKVLALMYWNVTKNLHDHTGTDRGTGCSLKRLSSAHRHKPS